MSDIPVSQTVIANALNQLTRAAPSSDLAQKGVEVLTKHLAGNILSLSKTSGLLPKPILLKQPDIKGSIPTNQVHQLKLSLNANTTAPPSLDFFSAASKQTTTAITLSDKQLHTLLSLPAKQLLISSPLVAKQAMPALPHIQATVLPPLPPEAKRPAQAVTIDGKALQNQHMTLQKPAPQLRLSLPEQRPPIEISLPTKSASAFAVGDKVSLVISPKGINWQVNVMANTSKSSSQKIDTPLVSLTSAPKHSTRTDLLSPQIRHTAASEGQKVPFVNTPSSSAKITAQPILLSPQQANPLIQASLREQPNPKTVTLEMPLKAVIPQLNKITTPESQALVHKLQSTAIDKLAMQIAPNGEAKLLIQTSQPVASIVITKEIATQLAPLGLPNQRKLQNIVNAKAEPNTVASTKLAPNTTTPTSAPTGASASATQTAAAAHIINKQAPPIPPQPKQNQTTAPNLADKLPAQVPKTPNETVKNPLPAANVPASQGTQRIENKAADTSFTLKEATTQLLNLIRDMPSSQSVVTPDLMQNKAAQMNLVQSLLRIVKAKAEPPAVTLQIIEKALSDPEFYKASPEQSGKPLLEQVIQQIKQGLPQGKEQDSSQIRQLLTAPTLNLSALQMVSPAPSQGIMGGLITLLQISLSARLTRNQAGRTDQITKVLNDFLGSSTDTKAPITSKALTDLSQLEQKHQLMKEIGRLLAGHQSSKLSNAEQMLQGQDSFYYNLPAGMGGNVKDIELLIKREEQNKDAQNEEQASNKTWQLTMKLAVGELGELLTKAKIRQEDLELHFYASNDQVKNQVLNYLPLLKRKLDSLGIQMSKSHCQLGKIPDTLQQRPYHVFQAKA